MKRIRKRKLVREALFVRYGVVVFPVPMQCLQPCLVRRNMATNKVSDVEREVKKATRDLNQLLNTIESPMTRLETVQKKYTELLADMKKLDRDYAKSKKRSDQMQKDQEKSKSELSKSATMKDKLEKLCRELTKENKKVKVCCSGLSSLPH